jgi:hypothetical protein
MNCLPLVGLADLLLRHEHRGKLSAGSLGINN